NRPKARGNGTLSSSQSNNYTISSFVSFLRFLKRRIIVDWHDTLRMFVKYGPVENDCLDDLTTQLYLVGLYSDVHFNNEALEFARVMGMTTGVPMNGVLSSKDPPLATCIVLSVSREHLRPIYDNC